MSLQGNWIFVRNVSDFLPGISKIPGCPMVLNRLSTGTADLIKPLNSPSPSSSSSSAAPSSSSYPSSSPSFSSSSSSASASNHQGRSSSYDKTQEINSSFSIEKINNEQSETILLKFLIGGKVKDKRSYELGISNFEYTGKTSATIGIIKNCDADFTEFELCRLGPKQGQNSREIYKLDKTVGHTKSFL